MTPVDNLSKSLAAVVQQDETITVPLRIDQPALRRHWLARLHSSAMRCNQYRRVHVSKCTAGVPPARGRLAGREDEGGRDARGTLWATHLL
ncbi:MAG: hypothetical protein ABSE73_07090, partial [Planctomycetota bacterium]